MTTFDLFSIRSRIRTRPAAEWRLLHSAGPTAGLTGGRLPLGTFAQGRPLRRAVAELLATTLLLLAAIAAFTLLQLDPPSL
jgi:hypothetical protein